MSRIAYDCSHFCPLKRGPKKPQKCTIVDNCAQIAESGLKPPFESPDLDFPEAKWLLENQPRLRERSWIFSAETATAFLSSSSDCSFRPLSRAGRGPESTKTRNWVGNSGVAADLQRAPNLRLGLDRCKASVTHFPKTQKKAKMTQDCKKNVAFHQAGMNGDAFSIKTPMECSKKFAATLRGKFLTRGNVLRIFFFCS